MRSQLQDLLWFTTVEALDIDPSSYNCRVIDIYNEYVSISIS